MSYLILLTTLITAAGLFIDSYFYPGALLRYTGVDSKEIFFIFALVLFFFKIGRLKMLPEWALQINRRLIFPILAFFSLLFILLENLFYPAYVLSTFGFHFDQFLVLTGFSGYLIYINRNINSYKPYQKILYLVAPPFLFAMILLHMVNPEFFEIINQEDHVIEYAQFAMFLVASLIAFWTAIIVRRKNLLLSLFSIFIGLFLFFIAGEEVSWGQRVFGLETPEAIMAVNYQDELTIHNVKSIHRATNKYCAGCLIGIWGAFGAMIIGKIAIIPKKLRPYLAPKPYLILYFLAYGVFSLMFEYVHWYYEMGTAAKVGIHSWQEVAELYIAVGFLMFTIDNFQRVRRQKK